jgi:hypothetical protein
LKSLFAKVAAEFHVVIQSAGGWSDLNVRAGMMRRFAYWEERGKLCVLLDCGDHDPGGLQISDYLRSNLDELADAVGWSPRDLVIDRFGLDFDFIETNGLVWIENLETGSGGNLADPKHRDHHKPYVRDYIARFGARKVEANALVARPEAGRELCRQAILRYVPQAAPVIYEKKLSREDEKGCGKLSPAAWPRGAPSHERDLDRRLPPPRVGACPDPSRRQGPVHQGLANPRIRAGRLH